MNNHATFATELLIMLVIVVVTSASVLFLVQAGLITVKAESEGDPILNTEFIPIAREGTLAIKGFMFCRDVDEQYNCLGETPSFKRGERVHFRFVIESSTTNGEIKLMENYYLRGPQGTIVLQVDESKNYHFEEQNLEQEEDIYFKDFIITDEGAESGQHTLELAIENQLLNKRVVLSKQFILQ